MVAREALPVYRNVLEAWVFLENTFIDSLLSLRNNFAQLLSTPSVIGKVYSARFRVV